MSAKKIESAIADHLATVVDFEADTDATAAGDANELIKLIEKSGLQIVRRTSPVTRERLKHRRAGWAG